MVCGIGMEANGVIKDGLVSCFRFRYVVAADDADTFCLIDIFVCKYASIYGFVWLGHYSS